MQNFSVTFHFLKNDKSYKRDFFISDSIDQGLSFYDIEEALSLNIFWLIIYTISKRDASHG